MEAILPGSSEPLLQFTKSGSLHRTTPLSPQSSLSYNPYSLAEDDPSVGNGSPQSVNSSLWQNVAGSTSVQPLNYMEPVSSVVQHEEQRMPVGTRSECYVAEKSEVPRSSHVVGSSNRLSASADAKPSTSIKTSRSNGNPRQAPTRSTISHFERDKDHPTSHFSRSNTERVVTKSPEHMYELDPMRLVEQIQPDQAPPVPKPRVKKPSPLKELSGFPCDSQAKSRSLNDPEPRYATKPQSQTDKEAEFEYPAQLPTSRGQTRPSSGGTSQVLKPDHHKPPVTPRKTKPVKQPEYLSLSSGDTGGGSDLNGSAGGEGTTRQGPDISGLPEEMVKNFTPKQLDVLITMLRQVQSDGQQPASPSPSKPQLAVNRDLMKKKFGKCGSLISR